MCLRSGGMMKRVAVVERSAVLRQILDLLGLPTRAPSPLAPPNQPDGRMAAPSWG